MMLEILSFQDVLEGLRITQAKRYIFGHKESSFDSLPMAFKIDWPTLTIILP
jgi:hypothetical protein